MMGKKPTKKQKQYIRSKHLNAENWLVCKDMPDEMLLKYKYTDDKYRRLQKKTEGAS